MISALLILIVNPVQCIFFVIFDVILQQIDGNILGPKILGNTTGLSSFWVLFSILLFGDLWGFAGMLLGVPVFAVIYHIISSLVTKGLKRNGQEEMLEEYARDFPAKQEEK
jgi:predicted PurR-regulated permease PerM